MAKNTPAPEAVEDVPAPAPSPEDDGAARAALIEQLQKDAMPEGIVLENNIQVVDNTDAPSELARAEYEVLEEDLGNGMIRTTYGDVKAA